MATEAHLWADRAEQKTEIGTKLQRVCKGRKKNLSGEHIKVDLQDPLSPSIRIRGTTGRLVMQEVVPTDQMQAADDQLCLLLKNRRYFRARNRNKVNMWIHWSRGGGGEVYSHWNEEENTRMCAECGAFCCCFCFQPLSICHSPNHFCQGTGNFISRPEAIKSVCKTFCVLVYSVLLIKFPSAAVTLSTNPPRLHWEEKHIIAHSLVTSSLWCSDQRSVAASTAPGTFHK